MKRLVLFFFILVHMAVMGQGTCPPQPLPFFDNFNDVSYRGVYMGPDDSLTTARCWTYYQPGQCLSYYVMFAAGPGNTDGGFLELTCGTMWCGSLSPSNIISEFPPRSHNQWVVSPPLQEQPSKLTFRRWCMGHASEHTEMHLVVGFVNDIDHIRESFEPIDTLHYYRDSTWAFGTWVDDSLLIPNTGRGECRVAFLMDTMLHDFYPDTLFRRDSAFYPRFIQMGLDNIRLQPFLRDTTRYYDTLCEGYAYSGYGFDLPPQVASGVYVRDSSTAHENHRFELHLTVLPSYDSVRSDSLYAGDTLWVADTALTEEGVHRLRLPGQDGACDTLLTVHLTRLYCVELNVSSNRDFIDFDYPVLVLEDLSTYSERSLWEFSDGYVFNTKRARRQFHHPLPDSLSVKLTSCNSQDCCADTILTLYPKMRSVWFPNTLAPGETFGVITSCDVAAFELTVYNRRGQIVFHTTDPDERWDGGGHPQGAYVFVWYLADTSDGRFHGKGTVVLLR